MIHAQVIAVPGSVVASMSRSLGVGGEVGMFGKVGKACRAQCNGMGMVVAGGDGRVPLFLHCLRNNGHDYLITVPLLFQVGMYVSGSGEILNGLAVR